MNGAPFNNGMPARQSLGPGSLSRNHGGGGGFDPVTPDPVTQEGQVTVGFKAGSLFRLALRRRAHDAAGMV